MNLNTVTSRLRVPLGGAMILALFAALPARADYQSAVLAQNPEGFWRLNETTAPPPNNNAANAGSLGASANGTYVNSPTRALAGPFADTSSVGFDGASQYVSTPWVTGLNTSSFTVEMWVKPAQNPVFAYVASSVDFGTTARTGWYLAQDDGSTFHFGTAYVFRTFINSSTTPGATVYAPVNAVGTWCHLVITYDGTAATMYTNGVLAMSAVGVCVPNVASPFTVGCRSTLNFFWPGQAAEVAMYNTSLSSGRVSTHYTTATTTPASYASTVLADAPVAYYHYLEANEPGTANIGTLGSAANGIIQAGTTPGVAGPRLPTYSGFDSANSAVNVPGTGPSVRVPNLNFNTSTLTISGWVKPSTSTEAPYGGIIVCDGGTTYAGLTMDGTPSGGLGLGYVWNNDPDTYNWIPATDASPQLPLLPLSDWAYVALVVQPDQAWIYTCASNQPLNFAGATNRPPNGHALQAFDAATLFGSDAGATNISFAGSIDEVAIFNRALGVGELYTQYGAAVGGLAPKIFGDTSASPSTDPYTGDSFTVAVDAGGTPNLTYQWSKLSSGAISGATGSSYTVNNAALGDSDTYSCHVANGIGGGVTSSGLLVTVHQAFQPAIVTPPANHNLYPSGTLIVSVVGSGGGLRYQWSKNTIPIPGATSSAYIVPSVVASNSGSYSVVVTNGAGTTSAGPAVINVLAPANTYETAIVADKPEAWFRLNETSGTTMFDSMGRHDGVYTNLSGAPVTFGAAGAVVGSSDTAVTFDGTGVSYGVVPFSPKLNAQTFSIECWAKTSDTVNERCAVSSRSGVPQGYMLWTVPAGSWSGGVSQGGNDYYVGSDTASDGIVAGEWKHIVMVYDTSLKVYVNGQWDGTGYVNFERNATAPFVVGALGGSSVANLFAGQVDEVLVYTNGLTLAQAQSHYSKAKFTTPIRPFFVVLPGSQEVVSNANDTFSLTGVADGPVPISYQWFKNGSAVAGATNTTFTVSSVYSNAGSYVLQATNLNGITNSAPATVAVLPPTPAYVNVTNGLVLHLTFDGNYADSSGRGNNGTATGTGGGLPSISTGRIGSGALHYETLTSTGLPYNSNTNTTVTASSYVTLGTPADLEFSSNVNFSVSYWVKLPVGYVNGDLPFLCSAVGSFGNPGFTFAPAYTNGGWAFSYNGVCQLEGPAAAINDGNWHHVLHTVDRTGYALSYVDGGPADSRLATSIGNMTTANAVNLGQDPTGLYKEPGSADIDDVAVWRRSLSAYEAYSIYYAATNSNASFNVPGRVTLHMTKSGTNLVLSWNPGSTLGTLQQADSLTGPWTPAGAYTPSFTVAPGTGNKFYRLSLSE